MKLALIFVTLFVVIATIFGSSASAVFSELKATQPAFDSIYLWVTIDMPTIIPTGIITPLAFTNSPFPTSPTISWSVADPDAILIKPNMDVLYVVTGNVAFESNPAGRRSAHINFYDSADLELSGNTIFSEDASVNGDTIISFSFPFRFYTGAHHLKLTVFQDSGEELEVVAKITIFRNH